MSRKKIDDDKLILMVTAEDLRYKRIFIEALVPFMDFLGAQQKQMTLGNWMEAYNEFS